MAKRIPAGEMRHAITIETQTVAYDSYGQVASSSTNWTTESTIRGKIETLAGREAELARQVYPHATRRVTIDYLSALNSTGGTLRRVVFGNRSLYIGAVNDLDEEQFQMVLLCGEER